MSRAGKAFFAFPFPLLLCFTFFSFYEIIDFCSCLAISTAKSTAPAFSPSTKNLTSTGLARFYPHKSRRSGAARDSSISSNCLFAEHLSLYRSRARPFTLSRAVLVVRTHGRVCGYTVCAQSLLRSADSKTANTRLGATKPQTKANAIVAGVSRAYAVSMSDQRRKLCRKKKKKGKGKQR